MQIYVEGNYVEFIMELGHTRKIHEQHGYIFLDQGKFHWIPFWIYHMERLQEIGAIFQTKSYLEIPNRSKNYDW